MLKDMYQNLASTCFDYAKKIYRESRKYVILYHLFELLGTIFHSKRCIEKAYRYSVELDILANHMREANEFGEACRRQAERFVEVEVEEP